MELYLILPVIFILSVIQSIVGVGLLVFGTPTLLLVGLPFSEVLGIVLPPSIVISLIQMLESHVLQHVSKSEFKQYCLPFVLIGIVAALTFEHTINIKYFVGLMLVMIGIVRLFKKLETLFARLVSSNRKLYQVFMGLIHGLTNMGGGLLVLFSASIHKDKRAVRSSIAYGYFFMGVLQYLTLIVYDVTLLQLDVLLYVMTAVLAYFVFGKRMFENTREGIFQKIVTSAVFIYGIILIIK